MRVIHMNAFFMHRFLTKIIVRFIGIVSVNEKAPFSLTRSSQTSSILPHQTSEANLIFIGNLLPYTEPYLGLNNFLFDSASGGRTRRF